MKEILRFSALLFILTLLAACQRTPGKDIVVNKLESTMFSEEQVGGTQLYAAPTTWAEQIENGNVTYNIHADISVPDVTQYPIIEVEPVYFDYEVLDRIVYLLVPDADIRIEDTQVYTKAHYQEEIDVILAAIQNVDKNHPEFAEAQKAAYLEDREIELDRMIDLYNTAPENAVSTPISSLAEMSMQPAYIPTCRVYNGSGQHQLNIRLDQSQDDLRKSFFRIAFKGAYDVEKKEYVEGTNVPESEVPGLYIEEERVAEVATSFLQFTGLDKHFSINGVSWELAQNPMTKAALFTKHCEGIPITYALAQNEHTSEDYAFVWPIEAVEVEVDAGYNVSIMRWAWLSEETNKINDNAQLLPFEDIQEIIRSHLKHYQPDLPLWDNILHRTIIIDRIVLGMMRISVAKSPGAYVMVPVWDCFGYFADHYASQEHSEYLLNENNDAIIDEAGGIGSFITLNAIDGSVIDRQMGY